jgi:phage major head subunit gpT-like protein
MNWGFGPYWQVAFCSRQAIDAPNIEALLTAMASQKNDKGEPLSVRGTHFIGNFAQCTAAEKVLGLQRLSNGADNPLYRKLQVVDVPWLL